MAKSFRRINLNLQRPLNFFSKWNHRKQQETKGRAKHAKHAAYMQHARVDAVLVSRKSHLAVAFIR